MARLVTFGTGESRSYDLGERTTLGRSSQADIQIREERVSRHHTTILRADGRWIIQDEKSSNGTRVNGEKVDSRVLTNGDRIAIGDADFLFVDHPEDPLIGTIVNGYAIIRPLGEGNMGAVYHARQISMQRDVALKLLKPTLARDREYVQRFESEARMAGKLNHANIVTVHDSGSGAGRYFFSMQFIDGRNLADVLNESGRLPAARVADIAAQIADGLAYAHAQGVIHQDIKPANIMLDANGTPKITDLGLAKSLLLEQDEQVTGPVFGTPLYMAPETIRRQPPKGAADVYALGAMCHHLVTGQPPFPGTAPKEILKKHLNAPVPDPRAVDATVPDALAEIIMRMLAKEPAERPSAQDVSSALRRLPAATARVVTGALAADPLAVEARTPDLLPSVTVPLVPVASVRPAATGTATPAERIVPVIGREDTSLFSKRNQAVAILYLASVLAAVLIFLAVAWILRPNAVFGPDAAQRQALAAAQLEDARALAARADHTAAVKAFTNIRTAYPDTRAAASASMLEAISTAHLAIDRVERDHTQDILSAEEAIDRLEAIAARSSDPGVIARAEERATSLHRRPAATVTATTNATTGPTPAAADAAVRAAWIPILKAVGSWRQEGRFDVAVDTLVTFIAEHGDSREAQSAAELLEDIQREQRQRFDRDLASAERLMQEKKPGEARAALEQLLDTKDAALRARALQAVARQDRANAQRIVDIQKRAVDSIRWLDAGTSRHQAQQAAESVADTPLASGIAAIQEQSRATERLLRALQESVSRNTTLQTPVYDLKDRQTLSLNDKTQLVSTAPDGTTKGIGWPALPLDTLWTLVPATALDDVERAGAALMMQGRGHRGYVRSYTESIGTPGALAQVLNEIRARADKRTVVARLDFTYARDAAVWKALEGRMGFSDNALSARTDPAQARLTGYTLPARFAALRFHVRRTADGGEFLWSFDTVADGRTDIAFTARATRITFTPAEGERKSAGSGGINPAEGVLIVFEGDTVAVLNGARALARLKIDGAPANARALVNLTITGQCAAVDSILLEESLAPPPPAPPAAPAPPAPATPAPTPASTPAPTSTATPAP